MERAYIPTFHAELTSALTAASRFEIALQPAVGFLGFSHLHRGQISYCFQGSY